jgi:ankyrin repeat protein
MTLLEEFASAIENGDLATMESLLASGAVVANARLPRNDSPPALVLAARHGKDAVDILLRANAPVDDTDEAGRTPCHIAAELGRDDVLALLLDRQPALRTVDGNGFSAFAYAMKNCEQDSGRCATMLLSVNLTSGALFDNIHIVDADLCRLAATSTEGIELMGLFFGINISNLFDEHGGTPLHAAASNMRLRDANVIRMLVDECGIDLEAHNHFRRTCLQIAAEHANVFALRCLISAGADVNRVSYNNSTLLHKVCSYECTVLLLAGGANAHARDRQNQSALCLATTDMFRWAVVHPLVAAGANLDDIVGSGKTGREEWARQGRTLDPRKVEAARHDIAKARVSFVSHRALEVCVGLQSLRINALQMCEILPFVCGNFAPMIPFHIWWKIATTVKHFRPQSK